MTYCSVENFKSFDGLFDVVKATSSTAGHIRDNLPLSDVETQLATTVKKTAGVVVFPQLVSKVIDLSTDINDLSSGKEKSLQPLLMDGLDFVANGCDCIAAAHDFGLLNVGRSLPVIGAIPDAITVVTDGVGFVKQIGKIGANHKKMEKARSSKQKNHYEAKTIQAVIRTAKKITSVAIAVFCLLSLFFASLSTFGMGLVAASVFYLVLTITDYFYSRSIEDNKKSPHCGATCWVL